MILIDLDVLLPGGAVAAVLGDPGNDTAPVDAETLVGMSLQQCHRRLRQAPWVAGIGGAVAALHSAGHDVRVVTREPDVLAEFAGRWGFAPPRASLTRIVDGRIAGITWRGAELAAGGIYVGRDEQLAAAASGHVEPRATLAATVEALMASTNRG